MRVVLLAICGLLLASSVLANPISKVSKYKAEDDLKSSLIARYDSHYSTVKMLLDSGMKSYGNLCKLSNNKVNKKILERLKKRYYPHFSTIEMLYKNEIKSYHTLNSPRSSQAYSRPKNTGTMTITRYKKPLGHSNHIKPVL